MEKTITVRGGQLMAQKYYPYLLDIVKEGKYDSSFMFTLEGKRLREHFRGYAKFNEHRVPGGLKVCLVTEFGRSQK
ncbi:hypothetical protein MMC30_008238 [Trapelia coarctata]|nr:hypothetical protein [Trapelia coarctata]